MVCVHVNVCVLGWDGQRCEVLGVGGGSTGTQTLGCDLG